jgi:predicted transcriptional regulator
MVKMEDNEKERCALTNPQHMVRYSLRMLEHERVIEPSSKGAVTTDEVPKILHSLTNALNGISKTVDKVIATLE